MNSFGASLPFKHFINDSNVSESTTRHYEIVTTARAICVEVGTTDAL
jgi:hypothetical protein